MIDMPTRPGSFWIKSLLLVLLLVLPGVRAAPPADAVASAHPLATRAAFSVFDQGGNAFDAAVAVSAALAVVEPASSGLGGGGFWLLHRASDGREILIDGRERAPFAASRDMYLDPEGGFDQRRSINGPLSAGIPGMPAAIVHLAEHYGKLPLKTSLAPAIRYAREGFEVSPKYLAMLAFRYPVMKDFAASAAIFLPEFNVPAAGFRLVQKDLADTLEQIAARGRAGFYAGEVAEALVKGVRDAGGIWALRDLEEYRALEREVLHSEYHGIRISSAPPPSSGGVVLTE
ncbi:MAG: gamma-glutamyltransferase, partial [Gammaproteobacteria bacterium]